MFKFKYLIFVWLERYSLSIGMEACVINQAREEANGNANQEEFYVQIVLHVIKIMDIQNRYEAQTLTAN